MNRKDFLALIPALSSVPFIGKELVREDNKIILLEPKPIEIVKEMPKANFNRKSRYFEWPLLGIQLTYNGHVVGHTALDTQVELTDGIAEGYVNNCDIALYADRTIRPEIKISATFRHNDLIDALMRTPE